MTMKITACPKCGSKNISMGTMGSGVTFGITSWKEVCRDCGYQGSPVIFDSEKEYKRFLGELEEEKEQDKIATKKEEGKSLKLSKKEKEIVEFLKELKEEIPDKEEKPIWHKDKAWWPEIVLALGIASSLISSCEFTKYCFTYRHRINTSVWYSWFYC